MIKLYRYLKPFAFFVVLVLIFVFIQAMADLQLPTYMADIINKGIQSNDIGYIWSIGGLMLAISGVGITCSIFASYFASKAGTGMGRLVRNKIFARVESFSLHEFDKLGTSTLITRTTNDITQVQTVTVMIMRMMIYAPMICIGGIIMALQQDKQLTLVLAVALPILIISIVIIAKLVIPLFQVIQKKLDKINLVLRENLTGIRVIRAFDRIDDEKKRFEEANADITKTYIRINRIMAFLMPFLMFMMQLTSISVIWFGAIRIGNGMGIGALSAFIQYAMQIMFSVLMVAMMFIMVPRAQAAAVRINEVLEIEPEIKDPLSPKHANKQSGYVEFKDVSFNYHGSELPAISNISFTAKPGEVTAIIGGTGSGKSTLVNLIPRFYDVDTGNVLIDGVDVREMTQLELRQKIGFVPQKTVLFSGTISENIRYGKEDATDEEIAKASEIAQATEFISKIEDGYDHYIAESGTNVSGGQKQRLSIARALVRRPEIYVFDDSFSALDFTTDAKLRAALKKETKDSTVFIISQRISTVMDADRIIVLDDGKIVGIGNHKELINSCEVYREIASSQLSEEELA
jgi:ATP-binding cassette subfamily B multidrug efflux pump